MNTEFKILENINSVDAPSFLFTNILQKISDRKTNYLSRKLTISIGAVAAIVVITNIILIYNNYPQSQGLNDIVSVMNLAQDNTLYK